MRKEKLGHTRLIIGKLLGEHEVQMIGFSALQSLTGMMKKEAGGIIFISLLTRVVFVLDKLKRWRGRVLSWSRILVWEVKLSFLEA